MAAARLFDAMLDDELVNSAVSARAGLPRALQLWNLRAQAIRKVFDS
jgi:hypothetical protein